MTKVPKSLRTWFHIHFVADYIFAIPLMIAPVWTMQLLGFPVVDPYTTRLVAAALFGVGGVSYLLNDKGLETYRTLLTLKIVWSWAAIVGLILTLQSQPVFMAYVILGLFVVFSGIWSYYYHKIK